MTSTRRFAADSNKLAYAQAFSRASTRHVDRAQRGTLRRSLITRRMRKHGI